MKIRGPLPIFVATLTLLAASCGGGSPDKPPATAPAVGPAATNGAAPRVPPGATSASLAATVAAATSAAKDAAGARRELSEASPALGRLIDAVAAGDVDGVMALIDWRVQTCGVRRDVDCGKAATGVSLGVVDAGWPEPFYVPADVLRPSLEQVLSGTPLQLRFAAQSTGQPALYYLGFDGPEVKGKGLLPLADSASNVTGVFITVDISRAARIVLVEPGLSDQYSAIRRGSEIGFESQRVIRFDEQY